MDQILNRMTASQTSAHDSWIAEAIDRRVPNHSLEGGFYHRDDVYRHDVERIWRRGWLFAGHTCEVARPGDFFALEVDGDPLLIIRGDDGAVRALSNVCRHRGSLLCDAERGHAGRIVCPYHQWSYGRDGKLLTARGMHQGFDRSPYGLAAAHLRELEGLIYISLADEPPDFEPARRLLGPAARPQGLERARVAHAIDYEVAGNWKLVWENNRECYHCDVNHPEYIRANFDRYNAEDTPPRVRSEMESAIRGSDARWRDADLAVNHRNTGMAPFPAGATWYSANRTPLAPGYVSESLDGRRVAPLMGSYPDAGVGTLRLRTLPNFWNHSSCDHAVSTRLLPGGPQRTHVRVTWLVHEEAEEGKDYQLETLLPFWQRTSEQDWALVKHAQRGVNARAYRPGPFSATKEYNVEAFLRWYLAQVE
ncbi:MAG: aromatic ring-hydroxylating dioxygenase subunit alpha [Isosphaeraceae bacterium]|nr:aromatic ring-hydroxylating dioxygenase subunit alpha [Isosphaeraceae bacterium]